MEETKEVEDCVIEVQESKLECAVCLEDCVQPVKLPCNHIFCYLCVKGAAQRSEKCALCREEIPSDYLDNPQLIEVQQPTVCFDGAYQWFYGGRDGWWQYDERTSLEIENSFKKKEQKCEVQIAGSFYTIDFEQFMQIRSCDPQKRRRIKRDLAMRSKKGIAGIKHNLNVNVSNGSKVQKRRSNKKSRAKSPVVTDTEHNLKTNVASTSQIQNECDVTTTAKISVAGISDSPKIIDSKEVKVEEHINMFIKTLDSFLKSKFLIPAQQRL